MRTYEGVMILDDRKVEGKGDAFIDRVVEDIRGLGGRVHQRRCLGRRHFAYKIKRRSAGTYWDLVFDLDPLRVHEFQDKYKLSEEVLRLVVFLYEEPPKKGRGGAREAGAPAASHEREGLGDEDGF